MADLDDLARNLGGLIDRLAGGAVRWSIRVALITGVAALVMYLLGLQALGGAVGNIWTWFGAAIGLAAVAAPAWAAWQLRAVHRDTSGIVADVRTVLTRDPAAQRVVIDTVEVDEPTGQRALMVYQGRDLGDLRRVVGASNDLRSLPMALAALTSLPLRLLVGVFATVAFAFVSFVFLIALAF
ncbi:MAG: hypothetical protein ACK5OX_09735 [Desertimonas sp.]